MSTVAHIGKAHKGHSVARPSSTGDTARAPASGGPDVRSLLTLQHTAGNQAVGQAIRAVGDPGRALLAPALQRPSVAAVAVQRKDPPLGDRVTALERHQKTLEKRQAATELDLKWRGLFGERLASYQQAVLRISGAIDAATNGFQAAQVAQAQADALKLQLIMMAVSVGFAAGFEWAFTRTLGKLGVSAGKVKDVVEAVENPANAAVSSSSNVLGARQSQTAAQQGQPPAVAGQQGDAGGGAVSYLTENLEALAKHQQAMEAAFVARSQKMQNATDEQWDTFDAGQQEARYQAVLDQMKGAAQGAEKLKAAAALAAVIERHMWALWVTGNTLLLVQADHPTPQHGGPKMERNDPTQPVYSLGTEIEDRMNAVGVSSAAAVTLTGHWYSANKPDDWKKLLYMWAASYSEPISA